MIYLERISCALGRHRLHFVLSFIDFVLQLFKVGILLNGSVLAPILCSVRLMYIGSLALLGLRLCIIRQDQPIRRPHVLWLACLSVLNYLFPILNCLHSLLDWLDRRLESCAKSVLVKLEFLDFLPVGF